MSNQNSETPEPGTLLRLINDLEYHIYVERGRDMQRLVDQVVEVIKEEHENDSTPET